MLKAAFILLNESATSPLAISQATAAYPAFLASLKASPSDLPIVIYAIVASFISSLLLPKSWAVSFICKLYCLCASIDVSCIYLDASIIWFSHLLACAIPKPTPAVMIPPMNADFCPIETSILPISVCAWDNACTPSVVKWFMLECNRFSLSTTLVMFSIPSAVNVKLAPRPNNSNNSFASFLYYFVCFILSYCSFSLLYKS